jgi:cell wall-associated NlpC family hydrolase
MLRVLTMTRGAAIITASMLAAACASSGAKPQPFPTPDRASAGPSAAPSDAPSPATSEPSAQSADDATLIDTALSLRGVPYRNGGTDPNGFDCSGFTQYVFARHGITLPRDTRDQFQIGEKVKLKDIRTGDLVFFHTVASGVSHVGIAVNDDEFVHAPSTAGVVRVEHIGSAYWSKRFVAARRIGPAQLASRPIPLPFPGALLASRTAN